MKKRTLLISVITAILLIGCVIHKVKYKETTSTIKSIFSEDTLKKVVRKIPLLK